MRKSFLIKQRNGLNKKGSLCDIPTIKLGMCSGIYASFTMKDSSAAVITIKHPMGLNDNEEIGRKTRFFRLTIQPDIDIFCPRAAGSKPLAMIWVMTKVAQPK